MKKWWSIVTWQGGSLLLTIAYMGFIFTGLALFNIYMPSGELPPISSFTAESTLLWQIAAGVSWAFTSFWAIKKFKQEGIVAAVLPSLCHIGWILLSFFLIVVALWVPSFTVVHVLVAPE